MVRIGINGAGRIGRAFLRLAAQVPDLEVVAVNDVVDLVSLRHLLRRDSTFGPFPTEVEVGGDDLLLVGDRKITVTRSPEPGGIDWAGHGVDVVLECTGRFKTREQAQEHLSAGARKVVLSSPGKGVDATIVVGVNDSTYDAERHHVVSNASCTTNCAAPMVKVLHDAFGIQHGLMTTVHAYTNDQNILDAPHKDPRRARAGAVNIIPTTTGAARAVGEVIPAVAGRLDGRALRVPVVDGSIVDLGVLLERAVSTDEVNAAFEAAASSGPLAGLLTYEDEPLVSSDIVLDPSSCVFDSTLTQASGPLVKVFGWYDNEWGYTNRLADLVRLVSR
ncbi:type I glyceraldehyde-3-phosphate dehydrogenase [Nocardioides daeguensis]|uniref:Type I glyceraldehyde-3-phosphate dehydrogenase n=1 Tax=Nocardioides daeguensis TaxID=908359 RepID=A0ABP6URT3_9ACTN|nr:type I glyceraldehyde-3-phosphate dehydrogenase [Nocardioides daeguensis]MBV6728358.1 type I glyceraldehyde-3-phosphate dehydrogenase [Nocardioides daeguensis]MCR1773167.1 type I glyceraldehyde-3-phosphate dehydrogenase [Nocardioides daeguensis]